MVKLSIFTENNVQSDYLQQWEFMIDKYCKTGHRHDEELQPEWVVVMVVCRSELGIHQIYSGVGRDEVEHLHDGVIQRHERREQVEIARRENHRKHNLRLARYSWNTVQQDEKLDIPGKTSWSTIAVSSSQAREFWTSQAALWIKLNTKLHRPI